MRIPLSWLSQFVPIQQSADEIATILTGLGIEVDAVETVGSSTVLELSLTPNLGHCASVLGIARELAAATHAGAKLPDVQVNQNATIKAAVTVEDPKRCPLYACRVIEDVKVGPSPSWMQELLTAAGLRPINVIVDVTNYVLLELGQPLHAFDYEKISGGQIHVRQARSGERFETLDEKERVLSDQDVLICDGAKPVALAGVMGGRNSEVTDDTRTVLLEAAYFDARAIRLTSKRLGLQTEASRHFDRGIDPNRVLFALDRAAMLLQQLAGGRVGPVTCVGTAQFPQRTIACRLSRIPVLLGVALSVSEVQAIFERLEMQVQWDGQGTFQVTVPTYRNDLTMETDLIEEIARLYGYNNLFLGQATFQASVIPDAPLYVFEKELRARLCGQGLQEFMTCDLIGPQNLALLQQGEMPDDSVVRISNPTAEEQSILRTSLLPGFLDLIKYNQDRQVVDVNGFELGRIYFKRDQGYGEQPVLGIVLAGKKQPTAWDETQGAADFFDLKGIVETLLEQLGITHYLFKKSAFATFHTGRQASLFVDSLEIGSFGEVHPAILRQLDIKQRVLFAQVSVADLMKKRPPVGKMKPLPLYPCSERDWTVTLDEKVAIGDILTAIHAQASSLLEAADLLYLYRSEKLGLDRKNATFHFVYRDQEKTVSQEVVEAEHARIIGETLKTLKL